jgi:hypothetical protein
MYLTRHHHQPFRGRHVIEDWGATDASELVRQLGAWRSLLLLMRHRKLLW